MPKGKMRAPSKKSDKMIMSEAEHNKMMAKKMKGKKKY